jgi:MFS family permease
MAWLANPFAYIAINTLLAVIPGIAAKFQMSPMLAGFVCSLWCFVRLGTFVLLWRWPGWHYRFRWLVTAFALLILAFAAILVAPNLAVLIAAQIFFGAAIGLIYYSSLFYSMDASDTKSEHGGIHEAAIGAGNFIGPAVGAAALWLAPQNASVGAWAVSGLLLVGFGGLLRLSRSKAATPR